MQNPDGLSRNFFVISVSINTEALLQHTTAVAFSLIIAISGPLGLLVVPCQVDEPCLLQGRRNTAFGSCSCQRLLRGKDLPGKEMGTNNEIGRHLVRSTLSEYLIVCQLHSIAAGMACTLCVLGS